MPRRKSRKSASKCGRIKHIKTTINGITFDSKLEADYYSYLLQLKANKIVKDIELQPEYILQDKFIIYDGQTIFGDDIKFNSLKRKYKLPTIQAIKYIADFKVTYLDGHIEVIDTKTLISNTPEFKLKKKLLLCKYPTIDFKVITKYKDEWILLDDYAKILRNKKKK